MQNKNVKKCHYFNNSKICPIEDIGCKFAHEDSEKCYFFDRCRNQLCQFKHNRSDWNKNTKANEAAKYVEEEEKCENNPVEHEEELHDVNQTVQDDELKVLEQRLKKYSATIRVLLEENQNLKQLKWLLSFDRVPAGTALAHPLVVPI